MISVKNFAWLVIIFAAAAAFRLTNLDLIEFKLDEARDVYEMERFYQSPYFIQRGTIQSTGVYNPPLWYYFLALISLPSRDPQYLSFMIALINSLAVVGFYLVVRRFYGQFIGLVAGLLTAFSPWMIVLSRKIWAPDLIFPLGVAWFYFLLSITHTWKESRPTFQVAGKKWAWIGLVLTLMLLAQLHASGIFLAVGAAIMLIVLHLRGVKAHLGGVLAGLLLGLIPLLPYLGYQIQNNCPDCQAFLTYQQGEALGAAPEFDPNAFLRPFQFINGSSWNGVLGEEGYRSFLEKNPLMGLFSFVFLLEFGLFILGAIFLCSPRNSWLLPGLILIVSLLVFLTRTPAHLYYFLIVSPISIVIYSLGISRLQKAVSIIIITTIIIINIIFTFSFYQFLGEEKVVKGDYGATYGVVRELAEEKLAQFKDRPDYELIKAEYFVNMFNQSTN